MKKHMKMMIVHTGIPQELWAKIFSLLCLKERTRMLRVCKSWRSIIINLSIPCNGFLLIRSKNKNKSFLEGTHSVFYNLPLHKNSNQTCVNLSPSFTHLVSKNLCLAFKSNLQHLHVYNPVTMVVESPIPPPMHFSWWNFYCFVVAENNGFFKFLVGYSAQDFMSSKTYINMEIYDSRSGCWTHMEFDGLDMVIIPMGKGEFINGCYYWVNSSTHYIVKFSPQECSWKLVDVPSECQRGTIDDYLYLGSLGFSQDAEVLLLISSSWGGVKIWNMSVVGSWSLLFDKTRDAINGDESRWLWQDMVVRNVAVNKQGLVLVQHVCGFKVVLLDLFQGKLIASLDVPFHFDENDFDCIKTFQLALYPFQITM